jgi:hypothetical protein
MNQVAVNDVNAAERHLRAECLSGRAPRPLLKQVLEIIGRPFDPFDDTIYWTHALKCIPKNDQNIRSQWSKCSTACIGNLRSELDSMRESELLVIALGKYATGITLALLNNETNWLREPPKIHELIAARGRHKKNDIHGSDAAFKDPFVWKGKRIYLASFRHGANSNRSYNVPAELVTLVKEIEAEEILFIRNWLEMDRVRT